VSASRIFSLAACVALAAPAARAQNITFRQTDKNISYPIQGVIQGDINRDGYPDFLFGLTTR
jgi:hypothetical protein